MLGHTLPYVQSLVREGGRAPIVKDAREHHLGLRNGMQTCTITYMYMCHCSPSFPPTA